MPLETLEIRNYLFAPDMLEHFIDYFEHHFIDSQEAMDMQVLGQFRVAGDPNRFVWLRGFSSMEARHQALEAFYFGPVWKQYGPFANNMMLEWHDVHLMRPLTDNDLTRGQSAQTVAAALANGTISPETGVTVIEFYQAAPGDRETLTDLFEAHVVSAYANSLRGRFVAETGENRFTRLPVIQNPDMLAVISVHASEEAYHQTREAVSRRAESSLGPLLIGKPESLLLYPTLRSPVRHLPEVR